MAGPAGLLRQIALRLRQPRRDDVRHNDREFILIRGGWPADAARLAALPEEVRGHFLPRHCRVYLDGRTLWPQRIEWWGPDRPDGEDVLLLETEFRDQLLNRPAPPVAQARR